MGVATRQHGAKRLVAAKAYLQVMLEPTVSRGPAQRGCERPRVALVADTSFLKISGGCQEATVCALVRFSLDCNLQKVMA